MRQMGINENKQQYMLEMAQEAQNTILARFVKSLDDR